MRRWLGIVVVAGLMSISSLWALAPRDQKAIESIINGTVESWNERDCQGFGDGFAEDADFVNIFGMVFSGREEIEARHVQIMQTFLKGTQLRLLETKLREVQPGLVVALIHWSLEGHLKIQQGVFTQVFVQGKNGWEITAAQNTLIR
jgi:uncharacterized protein (TIGR02246 family)